jgi:hypothetical protein
VSAGAASVVSSAEEEASMRSAGVGGVGGRSARPSYKVCVSTNPL